MFWVLLSFMLDVLIADYDAWYFWTWCWMMLNKMLEIAEQDAGCYWLRHWLLLSMIQIMLVFPLFLLSEVNLKWYIWRIETIQLWWSVFGGSPWTATGGRLISAVTPLGILIFLPSLSSASCQRLLYPNLIVCLSESYYCCSSVALNGPPLTRHSLHSLHSLHRFYWRIFRSTFGHFFWHCQHLESAHFWKSSPSGQICKWCQLFAKFATEDFWLSRFVCLLCVSQMD